MRTLASQSQVNRVCHQQSPGASVELKCSGKCSQCFQCLDTVGWKNILPIKQESPLPLTDPHDAEAQHMLNIPYCIIL